MTDAALFPPSLPVLNDMRRTASGREWLEQLPALVGEFRERWELRLGAPYHGGSCSWVAPARRTDGTRAVLKVTWPHREARPEGEVLKLWAGRGSVLVLEHDPGRYALLLERCEPGTELGAAGEIPAGERLLLGAGVLRRLWDAGREAWEGGPPRDAATSVERLSDVAAEWADLVEERAERHGRTGALDTGVTALGAELLRELPLSARRETVLHGDFNPGNLLAAERTPWLAIDAKPMYGDPAFDPWRLVEQIDDPFAHDDPRRTLAHRTELVADALGEDVARMRAWAVARQVEHALWAADGDGETARAEGGELRVAVRMLERARVLAELAGL
ncbi:aminoglycoside phosphotransferase family protein [Streptomyces winkii]|uniref:aminoglycoside phosphotransferase family protein n=1 Tax=Streptomyces winkii TaxID=3051178 RepID=UPI0028D08738|nr:aminoglycoside phosphotransferase family protein [Streptomyces sp. DSM 40971]